LGFRPLNEKLVKRITPEQKKERKAWCRKWKKESLMRVIFDDESSIVMGNTGGHVWYKLGEEVEPREVSDINARIYLWGIIWWEDKKIVTYDGPMNNIKYRHLLDLHVARRSIDWRNFTYMTDNASYKTMPIVNEWFVNHSIDRELIPVYSPKLNAIEYIWHQIKAHVKNEGPTDVPSFNASVQRAIQGIRQTSIRNTISHLKKEMDKYIKQK
jgi:transposase